MQVSELFVYPIKSCGGVAVRHVDVSAMGIAYDRQWMLVDSHGTFITQREKPELAVFTTDLGDGLLTVCAPESDAVLEIALEPLSGDLTGRLEPIQVWSRTLSGVEHTEGSAWFSARLKSDVRLVSCVPRAGVAFHDTAQVLVISQASLEDLNGRLAQPVPMSRFRPNIVMTGVNAFEEDSWVSLKTGSVMWHAEGRCGRCLVTTVDQNSGERMGPEPLRTLARYRRFASEICFGMYFGAISSGTVTVGEACTPGV